MGSVHKSDSMQALAFTFHHNGTPTRILITIAANTISFVWHYHAIHGYGSLLKWQHGHVLRFYRYCYRNPIPLWWRDPVIIYSTNRKLQEDMDVLGPSQYKDDISRYEDLHCKNKTVVKGIPILIRRYFDIKMIPRFKVTFNICQ